MKLGGQTTKEIDNGLIELIGPYGLEKVLLSVSNSIAMLSTGVVTSYALYILGALLNYILFVNFSNINILLLIILYFLIISIFGHNYMYKHIKCMLYFWYI